MCEGKQAEWEMREKEQKPWLQLQLSHRKYVFIQKKKPRMEKVKKEKNYANQLC